MFLKKLKFNRVEKVEETSELQQFFNAPDSYKKLSKHMIKAMNN